MGVAFRTFANLRLFTSVCYLLVIYLDVKSTGGMILFASMFSPALPMVVPEKEPQELGCDLGAWKLMNAGVTASGSYGTFIWRSCRSFFHCKSRNLPNIDNLDRFTIMFSFHVETQVCFSVSLKLSKKKISWIRPFNFVIFLQQWWSKYVQEHFGS